MKQPPRANQEGFSLIEAMVAILILSVSLLGLAYLQAQGSKFNTSSYTRTQATLLASELMDQARLHGPANIDVTAANDCDTTSVDPSVEKRCWLDRVESTLPAGTAAVSVTGNAIEVTIGWVERNLREDPNAANPSAGINKELVWNLEI